MCLLNSLTVKYPTLNSSIYSFDLDSRCNFLLQYIHQCNTNIRSRWLAPFYVVDVGCASSAKWNCACRLQFVYHVQSGTRSTALSALRCWTAIALSVCGLPSEYMRGFVEHNVLLYSNYLMHFALSVWGLTIFIDYAQRFYF